MAISDFRDFIYPVWYKNSTGNKISLERKNESYQIVKNKIILKEIPDEYYKVYVTNYYEIPLGKIPSATEYNVDYHTGEVTFNESENAKTVIVSSYFARGMIYIFADRVISEMDENNNIITETLGDIARTFKFLGEYNSETNYNIRNTVYYAGGSYICIAACKGITPANGVFWQKIASPGLGLVYRGNYDNGFSYIAQDFVYYSDSFYYCKAPSTGHLPTDETYWSPMSFPRFTTTTLKNSVTVGETPVSSIDIGISSFNPITDDLTVIQNTTQIWETVDYTIDGTTINKISGTWDVGTVFYFKVLKSAINELIFSDGSMLQNETVNKYKLTTDVQDTLNNVGDLSTIPYNTKTDIATILTLNKAHFNVKDFGAKGDGVTDDTDAILDAIQAAVENGGGEVFFPVGKYKVSSTIVVPFKCALIGMPSGSEFNTENAVEIIGTTTLSPVVSLTGSAGAGHGIIKSIGITRNLTTKEASSIPSETIGLLIDNSDYTLIENVNIFYHAIGMQASGNKVGLYLDKCMIYSCTHKYAKIEDIVQVNFTNTSLGRNGGEFNIVPVNCVEISGVAETIRFIGCQINPTGAGCTNGILFTNFIGNNSQGIAVFFMSDTHIENMAYPFATDSTTPMLSRVFISNSSITTSIANNLFNIDEATTIDEIIINGNFLYGKLNFSNGRVTISDNRAVGAFTFTGGSYATYNITGNNFNTGGTISGNFNNLVFALNNFDGAGQTLTDTSTGRKCIFGNVSTTGYTNPNKLPDNFLTLGDGTSFGVRKYTGACNANGSTAIAHNIYGGNNSVLLCQAWYKGDGGVQKPATVTDIDGTYVYISTGIPNAICRVCIVFTDNYDNW